MSFALAQSRTINNGCKTTMRTARAVSGFNALEQRAAASRRGISIVLRARSSDWQRRFVEIPRELASRQRLLVTRRVRADASASVRREYVLKVSRARYPRSDPRQGGRPAKVRRIRGTKTRKFSTTRGKGPAGRENRRKRKIKGKYKEERHALV